MWYRLSLVILLLFLGGCGPKLSPQDLGTVEFSLPKLANTDKPYQMPQLGPPVGISDGADALPLPEN